MQTAFNALPDIATEGTPPEVEALIEVKGSPDYFAQIYNDLRDQGSLPEVSAYLQNISASNDASYEQNISPGVDVNAQPTLLIASAP